MLYKILFFFTLLISQYNLTAQDPAFSQFYNAPLYLNPAFSGCAKNDFRLCFASRLQWLNLQAPLQYYSISADQYIRKLKASAGVIVNRFNEGYLKTTHASFIGTRSFGSNEDNCTDWFLNFAFQMGFTQKNIDKNKLLFPDQISPTGPTGLPSDVELSQTARRTYFDISAGLIFTYRNWMIGAAGYHLSEPNDGLIGATDKSRLPYRVTGHLSYVADQYFSNEGLIIVKPTAIVNLQGISKSLTVGSLFDFTESAVELGIWYKNNIGFTNNHSISLGVNIKLGKEKNYYHPETATRYRAGLSYDAELNSPGVKHTSGTTELGILYEKNLKNENDECPKPFGDSDCRVRYPWVFH